MSGRINHIMNLTEDFTDGTVDFEKVAFLRSSHCSQSSPNSCKNRFSRLQRFGLSCLGIVLAITLLSTYLILVGNVPTINKFENDQNTFKKSKNVKRNLVFMISDGMGPTSLTLTRDFFQYVNNTSPTTPLFIDNLLVGTSRTRSSSSLITDSAAGATAFSCAEKTYNGAIAFLDDALPCATMMEAAKNAGYLTGLVVTTRVTDATPAAFAAHVQSRSMEDEIAQQLVGVGHYNLVSSFKNSSASRPFHPLPRSVDLILGGGLCHFLPNTSTSSCREDNTNVIELARKNGFDFIDSMKGFRSLQSQIDRLEAQSQNNVVPPNPWSHHRPAPKNSMLPLIGLFSMTDIPYEIDRRFVSHDYPSLEDMTSLALRLLRHESHRSDKGFFLMIEGSRIDHAGHSNDPAAQVHEVLAYNSAVKRAVEFLNDEMASSKKREQSVLLSTSDHETGGLVAGRQLNSTYPDYVWYPSVLAKASHSIGHTAKLYREYLSESGFIVASTKPTNNLHSSGHHHHHHHHHHQRHTHHQSLQRFFEDDDNDFDHLYDYDGGNEADSENSDRDMRSLTPKKTSYLSVPSDHHDQVRSFLETLLQQSLGIIDAKPWELDLLTSNYADSALIFSDMLSRRAFIGWSTHGHSAVDVNIYSWTVSSPSAASTADTMTHLKNLSRHQPFPLFGNHENTEIGSFIRDYLAVDPQTLSRNLRSVPPPTFSPID